MLNVLGIFSWVPQEAKQFVKDLLRPVLDFIKGLLKMEPNSGDTIPFLVFAGACLLVFIILLIIICSCAKNAKKKKARRKAEQAEQLKAEAVKVLEDEETPVAEEQPVQVEETPAEEEKEEVVEEEQPAQEEAPVEEPVKEEVVEEVKEEKPAPVKKTTRQPKPAAKKEVPVVEEKPVVEEVKEEPTATTRVFLGKFEVFPVGDLFLYRLKASNGEILVVSEMYKTSKGALSAIETVKKNIETGNIQIYEDKHGLYQFKLYASNKRLLVASANYSTYQSCEKASNSFKKFASISPISILEEDPENLMEEISLMALTNKKNGKINIVEVEDEYEFQLKASNGVLLCTSASYKTKSSLTNAIGALKEAVRNGKFYIVKDKNGMFQFKLYTEGNRCIVVGEAYKTKAQAVSSANSVASFVPLADVVDKTIKETV